jgi:DNA-binding NtrC family response regulator
MASDEPNTAFRALIVEDEHLYAQAIGRDLERKGVQCDLAYSAAEAVAMAGTHAYQAILLDHKLPDDDGIRIIPILLSRQPGAALVMMTAFETIQNAIQAIRQGAEDYLVKQTSVKPIVERILEIRNREEIRHKVLGWEEHGQAEPLGVSAAMQQVREKIRKVALSPETTVLLTGETGVGKEVTAEYLHRQSAPPKSPFVAVDCMALPTNLVESILFGHEKGAFTGADVTREGAFFEAGAGTIFLDEIGEMDPALQGKLLRVLETRTYQRVGSVREYDVKARVVASSNRDLNDMVRQGRFRFDLFQRLSVFPIDIPPLCLRMDDVPVLAQHFLDFFCAKLGNPHNQLSDEVRAVLNGYDYPGNVRELKNIVEGAVITAEGEPIGTKHLPARILSAPNRRLPDAGSTPGVPLDFIPGVDSLETLEKKMIVHALQKTKGVKSEAAELLGISRYQLLRRIEKYKLEG